MFDLGAGRASMETYMRAYGRSGTIFSIVSLLAQSSATPAWHLYKKQPQDGRRRYSTSDQGSDQRTEVITHAALSLWNKPNSFHSGFEFREGSNQHQELTGETMWVVSREGGLNFPTSMWYVRPDRMEPVPDPNDYLLGWMYTSPTGEQIPLQLNEVIQERLPDPLDPFRGHGPVASILPNIDQQRYATEYQRNLFINGADPGGVITVDKRLSDTEWDELVDRWRESHQGVARAGRVGVLENGAAWTPAGHSNKDMEYGQLRLANRDEMREAWRMHKHMLGTSDDVNRANAQTAEEVFIGWQSIPRLERRKDTLNHKLLPMFGDDSVEFDYEDPSPDNREADNAELLAKANAAKALIDAGYDPHDVLETVGLPDMEVVEQATQSPAVPPGWMPAPDAQPGDAPASGEDMANRLRHVLSNGYVPAQIAGRR
jgi:HK97 family phage portal protein